MQRPQRCLIVGLALGAAAGYGLAWLLRPGAKDAAAELAAARVHLRAGEVQDAYDALLAAMRVAPGDPSVFDASLEFVRKVKKDGGDEAVLLAQDVHHRAAGLIPFLPLARLKDARAAHTRAGDELFAGKRGASPEDPLAEAEGLLTAARRADLPGSARARLLHEADAELGSQARRAAATAMRAKDELTFWKRWAAARGRYEEVQKEVLAALYRDECGPRVRAWAKKVEAFLKLKANASVKEVHRANDEIFALVAEGQRLSRDLAPYLEGGVDAAAKDDQDSGPAKHLTRLAQLREWNYNRWALDWVDRVEQSGGSALAKLRSLAAIDEGRLAPYVGQRFTETWKKFFDDCSRDEKVEATKLRILREYQP